MEKKGKTFQLPKKLFQVFIAKTLKSKNKQKSSTGKKGLILIKDFILLATLQSC